jgi:hypothetical protein
MTGTPSPWSALVGHPEPGRARLDTLDRFRHAMQAREFSALTGLFAADVHFLGPRSAAPARGPRVPGLVLSTAMRSFARFRYIGHYTEPTAANGSAPGNSHVLHFTAVDTHGNHLEGVDILQLNADGLISSLTIMIRPLQWLTVPRRFRGELPAAQPGTNPRASSAADGA